MATKTVSAIVVVHNGASLLPDCLVSLFATEHQPLEVIVVDNQSTDGSAELVRARFPQARLFAYGANPGFGAGNNRAFRVARGDYLFLLNQDATVQPDTIGTLAKRMDQDARIGIGGPKMLCAPNDPRISSAGLRANRILYASDRAYGACGGASADAHDTEREALGVTGSAMMLRREMVDQIGGFDERLFLYYEDLDICLRAWSSGWKVLYNPQAVAYHPLKTGPRPEWFAEFLDCRNRWRVILKNVCLARLLPVAARAALFDLNGVKNHLLNRRWSRARHRLRALLWTKLYLLDTLCARRRIANLRTTSDEIYTRFLDDQEVTF